MFSSVCYTQRVSCSYRFYSEITLIFFFFLRGFGIKLLHIVGRSQVLPAPSRESTEFSTSSFFYQLLIQLSTISRIASSWIWQRILLPDVALELDKLLGHLVVVALRENPQYRPAGLVHLYSLAQRQPTRARALLDDVLQLQYGNPDQTIVAREAIVLDADVQLVKVQLLLVVANDAEQKIEKKRLFLVRMRSKQGNAHAYAQ